MELFNIIYLLTAHWIAYFVFQDEQWATNKSKNFGALLKHTVTYSLLMFMFLNVNLYLDINHFMSTVIFTIVTFVAHTLTDFFTSKVVSRMFGNKNYGRPLPNFGAFTIIGFDQLLHFIQLFVTFKIIFG